MITEKYNRKKNHNIGECLVHREKKLMYINIPKNASSWTKDYLTNHYGFREYANFTNYPILNNFRKIVILRDPIDRWLSGITTYLMREVLKNYPYMKITEDVIKVLTTKIAFDEHTWTQTSFLKNINSKDCTFFMFDDKLNDNLDYFLTLEKLSKQESNANIFKNSLEELGVSSMKNTLEKYINNNHTFKNYVTQYYKDDYELINRVEFFQKKIIR